MQDHNAKSDRRFDWKAVTGVDRFVRVGLVAVATASGVSCAPMTPSSPVDLPTAAVHVAEVNVSVSPPMPTALSELLTPSIPPIETPLQVQLDAALRPDGDLVVTRSTTVGLVAFGLPAEDLQSLAFTVEAYQEEVSINELVISPEEVAQARQPSTIQRNLDSRSVTVIQTWVFPSQAAPVHVKMAFQPMVTIPLPGEYEFDLANHTIGDTWSMDQDVRTGPYSFRFTEASITTADFRRESRDLTRAEVAMEYRVVEQSIEGFDVRALWFSAISQEFPPSDSYGGSTDVVRVLTGSVPVGTQPSIIEKSIEGRLIAMVTPSEVFSLEAIAK